MTIEFFGAIMSFEGRVCSWVCSAGRARLEMVSFEATAPLAILVQGNAEPRRGVH